MAGIRFHFVRCRHSLSSFFFFLVEKSSLAKFVSNENFVQMRMGMRANGKHIIENLNTFRHSRRAFMYLLNFPLAETKKKASH